MLMLELLKKFGSHIVSKDKKNIANFAIEERRINLVLYKTISVIDGFQALSTNSMQYHEVAKECLPLDCIDTRFFNSKIVILLKPQFS